MHTLLIATQNQKKRAELHALVSAQFVVSDLAAWGIDDDIPEDADTFLGNARQKAEHVTALLKQRGRSLPDVVLADDSGLQVDALGGAPGVRSARFAKDAGRPAGDGENNALLLESLAHVPDAARTASFHCAIVLFFPATDEFLSAEGRVTGRIGREPRGAGGFGYDPLFLPDEAKPRTMAELLPDEKQVISHRGRALRAAIAALLSSSGL